MTQSDENDWATQALKNIVEICLQMEVYKIEQIKTSYFEQIVKRKVKICGIRYLENNKMKNQTMTGKQKYDPL